MVRTKGIPAKKRGNQVPISTLVPPELFDRLKKLSEATQVPIAAYVREALEDLLKKRSAPAKRPRTIGAETGEYLGQAFSDIELLVAADVIKQAISEGRKHLDPEALNRVLARLTMAYKWKATKATE